MRDMGLHRRNFLWLSSLIVSSARYTRSGTIVFFCQFNIFLLLKSPSHFFEECAIENYQYQENNKDISNNSMRQSFKGKKISIVIEKDPFNRGNGMFDLQRYLLNLFWSIMWKISSFPSLKRVKILIILSHCIFSRKAHVPFAQKPQQ